jgi:hypothetical protein
MADLHVRHQGHHAVHHAQSGAEDGYDRQFFAGDLMAFRHGDRRLDLHFLKRKVAGSLKAHQHRDLADKLTEFLHAGVLVAQDGKFVLDQRMVEYVHMTHFLYLL